jgi:hypothetical protein
MDFPMTQQSMFADDAAPAPTPVKAPKAQKAEILGAALSPEAMAAALEAHPDFKV